MRKSQIILLCDGLVFGGIGIYALLLPIHLASLIGFTLHTPAAITDFRATYGGFDIGLGLFFVLSSFFHERTVIHWALWAAALAISGFAGSRALGLLVDGHNEAITWVLFIVETLAAIINWVLVFKTAPGPRQ